MPNPITGEDYQMRSEFERLKRADVEQGRRIAQLEADLKQTRLDLIQSDAIRGALVNQSVEIAGDIARALNAVEVAFHAGYLARVEGALSPDAAYRAWTDKLKEQS